jgi:hypothetical protein
MSRITRQSQYAGVAQKAINADNAARANTSVSSSYAATASLLLGSVVSASYAATASVLLGGINNQVIALTGSNVTTTSATAVDVTGLVTPTLPANSTWSFEIYLTVTCSGTGGLRFGFTAPSGADGALFIDGTVTTITTYQQTSTAGALSAPAINRAAMSSLGKLYGRVIIGANAGVVQLQFASATGGQTSTITGTGISIMRITRVA